MDTAVMPYTITHTDFTIRRSFAAPLALVYKTWSDPAMKARWFIGPPDRWTLTRRALNFEVGGTEVLEGRLTSGTVTRYDARFLDIVPDRRIILSYDMRLDDRLISISLATVEFSGSTRETLMTYTEQMALLDGFPDNGGRKRGTEDHFDRLDAVLRA